VSVRGVSAGGGVPETVDEDAVVAALDWCLAFADELTVELEKIETAVP
jgi:hypothetical protein